MHLGSDPYSLRFLFHHSGNLPPSGLLTLTNPNGSGFDASPLKKTSVSAFWHERVQRRLLLCVVGSAVTIQSVPAAYYVDSATPKVGQSHCNSYITAFLLVMSTSS